MASALFCGLPQISPALAQDPATPTAEAPAPQAPAPAESKKKKRPPKIIETTPPEPDPKKAADAAADPMVQQLAKAGVKTCLPAIVDIGKETMTGVTGYARAANWQNRTPDERIASVILGQSYADGAPLPKAFAMLFGAPAGKTKCDAYAVQVIPTKEKCSALQTKITIRGKKLGELSGIPFLSDVNGAQVLLLPSAGDGCVLVGVRIDYAN